MKLLKVPYYVLFPTIMAFCSIGVYSVNSNIYDLYVVAFFGLLGYFLMKLRCEPAPLLLGFVLGPLLEENMRRAMILGKGDPMTFLTRPLSADAAGHCRWASWSSCSCRMCARSARRCSSTKNSADRRPASFSACQLKG